jgi:ribosomal protein L32
MRTDVEGPEAQKPGMVAVDTSATSPQKRGQKRTLDGAEKMTQAKMEVRLVCGGACVCGAVCACVRVRCVCVAPELRRHLKQSILDVQVYRLFAEQKLSIDTISQMRGVKVDLRTHRSIRLCRIGSFSRTAVCGYACAVVRAVMRVRWCVRWCVCG